MATAHRLADWCGPGGHAGRLGGDEFVAVVPDHGDLDARVEKLGAALSRPVDYLGQLLPVSASIGGVRVADLPEATLTHALGAADAAMYEVKPRGRRGRTAPAAVTGLPRAA